MRLISSLFLVFFSIFSACASSHTKKGPALQIVKAHRVVTVASQPPSYEVTVRWRHVDPKVNYVEFLFEWVKAGAPSQGTLSCSVESYSIPSDKGEFTFLITQNAPEAAPGCIPNGTIRAFLIDRPSTPIPDSILGTESVVLVRSAYKLTD